MGMQGNQPVAKPGKNGGPSVESPTLGVEESRVAAKDPVMLNLDVSKAVARTHFVAGILL